MVRDPSLFSTLAVVGVLEGVDRALDRIGAGTSKVSFTIEGDGLPGPLSRGNMFYSASDIAAASLGELWEALDLVDQNEFADPLFTRVAFTIEVGEARQTALIEEARPAKSSAAPGSVVDVHVRLRPYRQDPFELVVPLSIPEGIGEGPVSVSVPAGGGEFRAEAPTSLEEELEAGDAPGEEGRGPTRAESLENLIREFLERSRRTTTSSSSSTRTRCPSAGGGAASVRRCPAKRTKRAGPARAASSTASTSRRVPSRAQRPLDGVRPSGRRAFYVDRRGEGAGRRTRGSLPSRLRSRRRLR